MSRSNPMQHTVALALLALASLPGCANPNILKKSLLEAEDTLKRAHAIHARICAPLETANAESGLAFTRVEFKQGHVRRASEHLEFSLENATLAYEKSNPCGTADRDEDTIADVVDRCPDEPEDFDGVLDEDGCRDIDPNGDEDGDGIKNIDDACIDEPEDFDGHDDEDGCPETSDDTDGDGMIDVLDTCPTEAEDFDGFQDADGCPDLDNDGDGVVDIRDNCPRVPEDLDAWEDEDGCPESDNDLDKIPDEFDKCPNEPGTRELEGCPETDRDRDGIADDTDNCPDEPETKNGYLDEDGCPDTPPTRVKVTRTRIEITETIQFATGSANLLPASSPILDDVVKVLQDAPALKVRIEGHTDSQGNDAFNLDLSSKRAASVLKYLTDKGISPSRLSSEGYGETQPIDTNRTPSGRARNRRVEFKILR